MSKRNLVKDENFVNIQGWMVSKLELKGSELLIYAIIYGFSQDGQSKFTGSLQYLSEWTNSSKPTCISCLKSLIDKQLIFKDEKEINGVKFCSYYVNLEILNSSKKTLLPSKEILLPSKEILPNNIDNNIANIKENIIINNKQEEEKEKKRAKQDKYATIFRLAEEYMDDERVKDALKKYLRIRTTNRSLTVEQWQLLLRNLKNEAGNDVEYTIQLIEKAIAGGWMQIVYIDNFKGKPKVSYSSSEQNEVCDVARDENGNILTF